MTLSHRLRSIALAAGLGAVAVLGCVSAKSAPLGDHANLLNAVVRNGVRVFINPSVCVGHFADGWYSHADNSLVVCQDNMDPMRPGYIVEYTQNDLDTIRHEAHHLVQDCLKERDGDVDPFFDTEEEWTSFVTDHLTEDRIDYIIENYQRMNADGKTIVTELEAFAVARAVSPRHIAEAIDTICKDK
ncbi:hypothetical protein [Synechococcus phage S-B68]|nr:hypothetical protein [Synechococcus phage S-B68]